MALVDQIKSNLTQTPEVLGAAEPDLSPDDIARSQALGMIEHLRAVESGGQSEYSIMFVIGNEHHQRQRGFFLRELGVELEQDLGLAINLGKVILEREMQFDADDAPFSLTYTAKKIV